MIHRHDTECNNKIRFYAKMTPSLFMGRKHTQIRIPKKDSYYRLIFLEFKA